MLDAEGKEQVRIEGYLPRTDFMAALECGLGRIAFTQKKFADAERWYDHVVTNYRDTHSTPGAMYWRAVSHYKSTNDHTVLSKVAEELKAGYPSSIWATKANPWLPEESRQVA